MTQSFVPATPTGPSRGFILRQWQDPENRSTIVGLAGVVIFYLLVWLVGPYLLRSEPALALRPHATPRQFSIELSSDTFVKPTPKPPPDRFVETNPDAPENEPDKTRNFAARNQQVAQEKPTPNGKNDMPALEGKKDF